jgi:hypothetical protein
VANPENLEAPPKSEKKPASDKTSAVKALGSTAIKGTKK